MAVVSSPSPAAIAFGDDGARLSATPPSRRRKDAHAGSGLNALSLAILVVQADHRVLYLNRAADAALQRGDGLAVRKAHLTCPARSARPRLTAVIAAAARANDPAPGAFLLERPGALAPYQVTVAPGEDAGTAIVMFQDPDRNDPSLPARLRALYALTSAEASLALLLSRGASLAEIARQRGVTAGTVRTQIKSIAAKMHCRRQAEIAAIIARIPQLGYAP